MRPKFLAPLVLIVALLSACIVNIPPPASGASEPVIVAATYSPTPHNEDFAAFRISSRYSHMAFADPIVAPGNENFGHLHTFFGATGVDAYSTAESIADCESSTSTGGTANCTSYWVPTMLRETPDPNDDPLNVEPVTSFHDVGQHTGWQHTGSLNGSEGMQVYYKSGYQGVPASIIENFPAGLRMIAGDATRTSPTGSANPIVSYDCISPWNTGGHLGPEHIPACAPGNLLTMTIRFPQCWDGRNLDSADHKSHMAYGLGWPNLGCPASHPRALPEVTYNVRYYVQPGDDTTEWFLSSDESYLNANPGAPAGYSGHGDWFNGWDPAVFQTVIDNCYDRGLDCHMNLLGDGRMLGVV